LQTPYFWKNQDKRKGLEKILFWHTHEEKSQLKKYLF